MADTDVTGATKEVSIDTAALADKKKKIIKTVVIAAVVILVLWFVYKRFLK